MGNDANGLFKTSAMMSFKVLGCGDKRKGAKSDLAKRLQSNVTDIVAVNLDAPRIGIIQASEKLGGGGFTRPCGANKSNRASCRHGEADFVKSEGRLLVRESHILEVHAAFHDIEINCTLSVRDFWLLLEQG